ncbi:N-acetylmuramoyl-L-alanine amidase [Lentibacillus sp. CBA3610]|uniref:N-acetylmuramoyl-L-alanine amidase n=1 Tax=Lentibacillus sp. CBA3610 TaxID=2518176 RepID=UPI0015955B76|nr:N-acetylmuramoyl-L-alanine amidase [Lentibacillus sp. CBA3610]QKY70615.1 hypothetical protein Len3610_14360 [Lentibacillus sp. CBA3610]
MGKIRFFMITTGFVLFFALLVPTAQAEASDTYQVGTNVLNVRSAPSHSADVVGYLGNGDRVNVFQERHGWAQTYYDGQVVWVASQYLFPAEGNNTAVSGVSSAGNESSDETQAVNESSAALNGYTIVLDPGHGGADPGAIGIRGTLEKSQTMKTADNVAQGLREAGANVVLTRSSDSYVSLEERVNTSNTHATDAFISLHYNAFPLEGVNGFSTYYDTNGNNRALADDIQSGLEQHMDLNSRGLMQNDFHVLQENNALSALVELGFITNPYDLSVIQTADHQRNVADGIVDGVTDYFND